MSDIETVVLDGSELKVEGLSGQNTIIINKSDSAMYASVYPNIVPDGDNVIEIAANDRDGLYNTNGTLYLLGTGKVELRGTDYSVNFKKPSRSAGSGGITPMAETMPVMNGITGYFIPRLCDQTKWTNLLCETDKIEISGDISIEENVVHFSRSAKGVYKTAEPSVIYAVMASEAPLTDTNLDPFIMKGMTVQTQAYGIFLFGYDDRMLYGAGGGAYDIAMPVEDRVPVSTPAVYAIVNSNEQGTFYLNGKNAQDSRTRISGNYSGSMIINGESGTNIGAQNDNRYVFIAFGQLPHTDEQIKQNSEWLMKKYLGGG